MKRKIYLFTLLLLVILTSCNQNKKETVTIWTSAEDYRVEEMRKVLAEEFPQLDIEIEYYTTGNHAAKIMAEGKNTECDISYDIDYGYYEKLKSSFAVLSGYDTNIYDPSALIIEDNGELRILPEAKNSGTIVVNRKLLQEKGLPIPTSYEDLTNPIYKGLISMPNPKTSGTGYMFLKLLVNAWGEDAAFDYFDRLAPNILQFTSSGSGPVSNLIQGETAIGFAMIAQAVEKMPTNQDLQFVWLEEGAPYNFYGCAIIEGKQNNDAVKEVYNYLISEYIPYERSLWFPEKIYKDQTVSITGYPDPIAYGDMSGNTTEEKEHLLNKWKY